MATKLTGKFKINEVIRIFSKYGNKYNLPKITNKQEYYKQYYLYRNRIRHAEILLHRDTKQSATDYLFNKAKTIEHAESEGVRYEQSKLSKFIESVSARSTGIKGLSKFEKDVESEQNKRFSKFVEERFSELKEKNKYVAMLYEKFKNDPYKLNEKLKQFASANRGKMKVTKNGVSFKDGGKPDHYEKENDYEIYKQLLKGDYKP